MSDSFLDHIPSTERQRILKRMRSPEEYERLRENVKGPEDVEKEMDKNEALAELSFALETEPSVQQALKQSLESALQEQGIENVVDSLPQSPEALQALREGKFTVRVAPHPTTHEDQLTVVTEGVIQEDVPVKVSFSETYSGQWMQSVSSR